MAGITRGLQRDRRLAGRTPKLCEAVVADGVIVQPRNEVRLPSLARQLPQPPLVPSVAIQGRRYRKCCADNLESLTQLTLMDFKHVSW